MNCLWQSVVFIGRMVFPLPRNKFSGDPLQKFSKTYLFIGAYSPSALPGRCLALYIFKISSVAGKHNSSAECLSS